jgi:hypothetical protein
MGYALIWIEGLLMMSLAVAAATACVSRWSWRLIQYPVIFLFAIVILTPGSAAAFAAWMMRQRGLALPFDWFYYTTSWIVLLFVLTTVIVARGLRRSSADHAPAGRAWSPAWLAAAVVGMGVLLSITITNMDLSVQLQMARAREQIGTLLQSIAVPPVAEQDDAVPLYRVAFEAISPLDSLPPRQAAIVNEWHRREFDAYSNPHPIDRLQGFDFKAKDLKEYLAAQEKGLALFRRAGAKPACRPYKSDPFDTLALSDDPPFEFQVQFAAQPLALDARVRAADGEIADALNDVSALLGSARQAYADMRRTAPSHYPAILEELGLRALEDVLQLARPDPKQLGGLALDGDYPSRKEIVRREAGFAALGLTIYSPEAAAEWYWKLSKHSFSRSRIGQPTPADYQAPAWFEATLMPAGRVVVGPDLLESVHHVLRDCDDAIRSHEPVEPYERWLNDDRTLEKQSSSLHYIVFKLPFYNNLREIRDAVTRRRLAQIAVAMIGFRAKNGKYPDKLADLVPASLGRLPVDPWDEGTFYWRHNDKERLLYTRRNGTDELHLARDDAQYRRDVVFRLPE